MRRIHLYSLMYKSNELVIPRPLPPPPPPNTHTQMHANNQPVFFRYESNEAVIAASANQ